MAEDSARVLFERSPVAMWVWDPETLMPFDVNRAALEQYGYTREEFLSLSLLDLRPEEERERFRRTAAEVSGGPDALSYFGTWRHTRNDGSGLQVEVWSSVIDWRGRTARISIGIDVTDRMETEAALKEAEARFRQLVESIPACVSLERMGTREILYVGPRVGELLGYPLEDWRSGSVSWRDILHPDDRERVLASDRDLHERPARFADEYRVLAADGRTVWVRDETVPVKGEPGEPGAWLGFWTDVTERKEVERALREAEERYRLLVEATPAAVYLDRIEPYEVLYTSPRIEEMLGYPVDDWVSGKLSWHDVLHPDDRERVIRDSGERDRGLAPYTDEYRVLAADGRVVWVRDQAVPVPDESGESTFWQGFWVDVTERREAEEALRRAEVEKRELLSRLVAAGEAERGRLAEDLHDAPIQNLTALQLRLESLNARLDGQDRVVAEAALETVGAAIRSLRSMMFELQPRTLERDGLETTLRAYLTTLADESGLDVALRSALPSEPPASARSILYRIAQEALANARKHARASRVEVKIERAEGGYRIRIEDDGVGFDPDAQGPQTYTGLAAMRDRAELSGGHLRVAPGEEKGTVVEAFIPEDDVAQKDGSVVS